MIPVSPPAIDSRSVDAVLAEFQNRQHGYLPSWNPAPGSAGAAIGPILAQMIAAVVQRLNQVPAKGKLVMLDLLGLRLVPAQPARTPIVFSLTQGASDTSAPEGTQVAAPPPVGSTQQIVFSTEQDAGVAAAVLSQVVSLWPGRDEYIDHSAAFAASQPFTLFQNLQLQPTEHTIYLAHSKYLAFAGTATLKVAFDLAQEGSSPLEIAWEYWDGQVWRGFFSNQSPCFGALQNGLDGTNGLSVSGAVQLNAQGAQTAQTAVNGVTSYWLRARVTQPLLPDPNQLLPEVETIRLVTVIQQDFEATLKCKIDSTPASASLTDILSVTNGAGSPLVGAAFKMIDVYDPSFTPVSGLTDATGNFDLPLDLVLNVGHSYQFSVTWSSLQATATLVYTGAPLVAIDLVFTLQALRIDKAFADGKTLDVSKAFQPFGALPQVGSAFYFKQAEAFSKPGATVRIFANAITPDPTPATGVTYTHIIAWEYWNGYEWSPILASGTGNDFVSPQIIQFIVPNDMVSTKVNNEDGLWVRVRIAGGKYGYLQTLTLPPPSTPPSITFPVIQAPVLADFRVSYSWQNGPFPLEQVFTRNDFQFIDRTDQALWPGNQFAPYQLLGDVMPALYLGFSQQLPVNNFGIYLEIVEQAGVTTGPEMVWEYWNGGEWASAPTEDETQNLALAGMITLIPSADARALARFSTPLYWFRGRLKEDEPPNQMTINAIFTNAVWASQWQTYANSPLGTSIGTPSQMFKFNQIPILPGQEIEVQELSGPRANTEWRSLAMEVVPDDPDIVTQLATLLAAEGPQTDIILGIVHLVRNQTKSVTAVWIQWQEAQNFFDATPDERVYVLDHALGRLFFGDGNTGMTPPLGAQIQATWFLSGGGLVGNVEAATITQLLGSVPGVQGVTNPRAAEGGADGETMEQFQQRAPANLRNRDRAIVPSDYEALAQQASAGVALARAFPTRDAAGITRPGWVTVMIIPQSNDPQPMPSAGLRQEVLKYLLARTPADLAAAGAINVVGPSYLPVDVTATIAPADPAEAGTVEQKALDALAAFLNPLTGGPGGLGWDVGRGLYTSDIAGLLGDVSGVDYVLELALFVNGVLQGDEVQVPVGQIVVAGQFKVSLVLPVTR